MKTKSKKVKNAARAERPARRSPMKFISIFGPAEANVAGSMTAEGKITQISKEDTIRAGAPTKNDVGAEVLFSIALPAEFKGEFERRVERAKLKADQHTANPGMVLFYHCAKCVTELPAGESPRDWARLSVGATAVGIQIWCVRHDCNVAHIDFEGYKHPAILHP